MVRGHRTAYLSLLDDEKNETPVLSRKGRSELLITKRNELLAHRHYYYVKIKRKQFPDAINDLIIEFHIRERTIIDLLQKTEILQELNKKKPTLSYFKGKYPYLQW